jgi:hypothetical protein
MDNASNQPDNESPGAARRFLSIFMVSVAVIAFVVACVNLVAYRYMLREDNQAIVQLLSGWGRLYKPILYDEIKPEVAVFGASWARDAFDPGDSSQLLGRRLFNHGVSGGTAYETRRFADSALANPNLQTAIINLDSFHSRDTDPRYRYGFDESILNLDSEHQANRFIGLRRTYSLALGGWAVGANINLISAILARDHGATRSHYLESYQQGDLTRRNLQIFRQRIFPSPGDAVEVVPTGKAHAQLLWERRELETMIHRFCDNDIDIYAYFTPSHVRQQSCEPGAGEELAALEFLRSQQRSCSTQIHYFNFAYPNVMTLEGVLTPVTASRYYRPDGHPRPTVGLAMGASMFDKPYPADTPQALQQDFGVDLLTHPDAENWLRQRARRCTGDWGEQGYGEIKAALEQP